MRFNKKIILVALCVLVVLPVLSCAGGGVVAKVNGVAIARQEYLDLLNASLSDYDLTADTMTAGMTEEEADEYKNAVVENLVLIEVVMQKAEEMGIAKLSAEEIQEIENSVEASFTSLWSSLQEEVETEVQDDPGADIAGITRTRYNEYLEESGVTKDSMIEEQKKSLIINKLYAAIMEGYQMTEKDVKLYYDENLERLEAQDVEDPRAAFENYINGGQEITIYTPSLVAQDTLYVKHVLVKISDETLSEISMLEQDGKTEEANALRQEALDEIRPRAEEVLKKALEGDDFEALIEEYGEDTGMSYYPEGYFVYEGSGFVESFEAASLALKNVGDVTPDLVESEYGYHIIKMVSRPEAGPVPYADVEEEILSTVGEQRAEEFWNSMIDEWVEAADIVYHELS
ncbi:SurA N-terminal domain-containing protein [Christensenellaceae bacterium OttesenSCG-928-K19]|nr:SurA N-terminal domain-containing protein [Christensenellaceae bacterium OttesenSCG-928-K19]